MYNDESIKALLIEQFKFLHSHGFQFLSFDYFHQQGGRWGIKFESNVCLLEVYNEEDQANILFFPLDATSDERFGIRTFVYYISAGEKFIKYYKGDTSNWQSQIEWLAKILEKHLDEIMKMMKNLPQYKDGLEKAGKEYFKKFMEEE
jgi:hypothetical protein